jgi:CheY-like chemotaxis protein
MTRAAVTTRDAAVPRRVLVVDDNPDVTSTLCAMLEAIGHECQEAYDGQSALVGVDVFAPHVMFLDLAMPLMNGFEVIERVRQRPGGDDMIIIAITGRDLAADADQVRQAGFDDCLIKPVALDAIRALVDGVECGRASAEKSGPPPSLVRLMTAADEACARADSSALASAMLGMVSLAPDDVAIDLVAVLELCRYDMELAALRWSNLRGALHV